MTIAEARQFIQNAEKQPPEHVDIDRLNEAIGTLQSRAGEDAWLTRAAGLVSKLNDRGAIIREERQVLPETAIGSGRGPGRTDMTPPGRRSTTRGSADPDVAGKAVAGDGLTPAFRRRLTEAASEAGIPPQQVEAMVGQAVMAAEQSGGAFSAEMLLGQTVEGWEEEARAARGSPIGVPDSFVAQPEKDRITVPGQMPTKVPVPTEPRYFEGDQFSPAGLDPAEIARIQTRLVNAGMLNEGEYWAGFWDAATSSAYTAVLGYANQQGATADDTIDRLIETLPDTVKEQRAREQLAKTFQADPFIKPDPAFLAQRVKEMFRSELGRDPKPEELAGLVNVYGGEYRAAYETQVAADRAAFDAEKAAEDSIQSQIDAGVEVPVIDEIPAGTFQGIDPSARFAEAFERRFAPEMRFREGQADTAENMNNVFASLRTMSSLVGG